MRIPMGTPTPLAPPFRGLLLPMDASSPWAPPWAPQGAPQRTFPHGNPNVCPLPMGTPIDISPSGGTPKDASSPLCTPLGLVSPWAPQWAPHCAPSPHGHPKEHLPMGTPMSTPIGTFSPWAPCCAPAPHGHPNCHLLPTPPPLGVTPILTPPHTQGCCGRSAPTSRWTRGRSPKPGGPTSRPGC